jgi:Holliday junction DNA helicase RuvB
LELYTPIQLKQIVERSASILNVGIDEAGSTEIAKRSRGTPRIANRVLKRVRDFAQIKSGGFINLEVASYALDKLEIDPLGLDKTDRSLLLSIINKFSGGPVGLDTLAATTGEEAGTIEDVYEPYLMQIGFMNKTPRGRTATKNAYNHFGIDFES